MNVGGICDVCCATRNHSKHPIEFIQYDGNTHFIPKSIFRFTLLSNAKDMFAVCYPRHTAINVICDALFPRQKKKLLPLTFQVQERMVFQNSLRSFSRFRRWWCQSSPFYSTKCERRKKCVSTTKFFTETVKLKCMRDRFVLKHFFPSLFVKVCREKSIILSSCGSNS